MHCSYSHGGRRCSKQATRQLNIANRETGSQSVYYYCEAHALMRISELQTNPRWKLVSAEEYELAD